MSVSLQEIVRAAEEAEKTIDIDGLHGAAKGLVISALARSLPKKTILALTATSARAQELIEDCSSFIHPDSRRRIALFPESSVIPFSRLSPEPEDWAERLYALHRLMHGYPLLLIAPIAAAMRAAPPKEFMKMGARVVRKRESLDPVELASYLAQYGYEDVGLVEDEGSFARRGGIVDLWPPTEERPVRLEMEEDRILSMRSFDPSTQRSREERAEILVTPIRDFPFDESSRARAAHRIRERSESGDLSSHERRALIEAIHEGIAVSGIETLMPLFHERTQSLFDYLPPDAIVIQDEPAEIEAAALAHWAEVSEMARDTKSPERIMRPNEIVLPPEDAAKAAKRFRSLNFNSLPALK